jgi:hypothetical protein
MSAGPQNSAIIIPVPVAATTDFGRRQYPQYGSIAKPKRETWRQDRRQPIPAPPPIDRELIERLKDQARRIIEQQRSQIKAMLGYAA